MESTNIVAEILACRHSMYGHLNDLIKWSLVTGGFYAARELPGVSKKDDRRPDGVWMIPGKIGKCLIWDFTCGDSLVPSHVIQTYKEPWKVASQAENR